MSRPTQAEMLGFQTERKITIDTRHWDALKRLVWRMKTSWGFVENEALALLTGCRHVEGCRGATDSTAPCLPTCPDRQTRLSALMIAANAREFSKVETSKGGDTAPYMPPTREFFDGIVGDLVTAEMALEDLRKRMRMPETAAELAPIDAPVQAEEQE